MVVTAPVSGESMVRLKSLPSETTTVAVALTGSWIWLSTLLSPRSAVTLTCTGPCTVPAWNVTLAIPLWVTVSTLVPVTDCPAALMPVKRASLPAGPMIWNSTLSNPFGSATPTLLPSVTFARTTVLCGPPEPDT